nr:zinc-dependent alcohol dehydrogenase family protein [Ramlibacter aurantiacus]
MAIQVRHPGGPEVLECVQLPEPAIAPGLLRVRARAIGVGKPDVLIRQGIYRWMPPLPAVPGNELAGEVAEVGPGVTGWRVGDRALVSSRELAQRGGCYAQEICVPAQAAFRLPPEVPWDDAVSLPNYQLAGALLHASGGRVPGSFVVHGGAGGVAIALAQMAAVDGIRAIATASTPEKAAYARRHGGAEGIDRSREDVAARVRALTGGRGVDVVFDHVGGPGFTANLDLLAPLGTLVSYNALAGLPTDNLLEALRRHGSKSPAIRCYTIHTLDGDPPLRRALLQRAIDLLAQRRIHPPPATCLPLSQARRAHEMLDAAVVLGKIVLRPEA